MNMKGGCTEWLVGKLIFFIKKFFYPIDNTHKMRIIDLDNDAYLVRIKTTMNMI